MNSINKTYLAILFIIFIFFGCISSEVYAQLSLSKIFSNGAVLQRDHIIPVWGRAGANDTVSVIINSINEETQADANGDWYLELPSISAMIKTCRCFMVMANFSIGKSDNQ